MAARAQPAATHVENQVRRLHPFASEQLKCPIASLNPMSSGNDSMPTAFNRSSIGFAAVYLDGAPRVQALIFVEPARNVPIELQPAAVEQAHAIANAPH